MIRVLIVDDQALFREGLRAVLTAHGVEVVGEAKNGEEAVDLAAALAPDVVLMDLRMPVLDGPAATRRIRALPRAPRVIALTTFDDDESVFDAVRAGAQGYLLKDTHSAKLLEAIQLAVRGESLLEPAVAAKLLNEFARTAPVASAMRPPTWGCRSARSRCWPASRAARPTKRSRISCASLRVPSRTTSRAS